MRSLCGAVILLAACGEDETCEIKQPGELPATGEYIDPYALPLPPDCIEGGLAKLPGRWFVVDPSQIFSFSYPRFEGDCEKGLRESSGLDEDHDITDNNQSFYTWSDGTRLFQRLELHHPGSANVYVAARVFCAMPDDKLAATEVIRAGSEPQTSSLTGTRFGRKDALADGIELVGELGTATNGAAIEAYNLVVDGPYAYVAGDTGFDVIDVGAPGRPVAKSHLDGYYNDVKVVHAATKTYAIIPSLGSDERTYFVDVTNPTSPAIVSSLPYSHSLFVQQRGATTELYLADLTRYVPRYDITDPLAPKPLGMAAVPDFSRGGVHDVFIDGDRIYANNTSGGFVAFDVSASFNAPTTLGRTDAPFSHSSWAGTAGGRAILLHGDEGMTKTRDGGAYLRVLDGTIGSPTFMTDIGRYQTRP